MLHRPAAGPLSPQPDPSRHSYPGQAGEGAGALGAGSELPTGIHLEEVEERVVGRRAPIFPLADQDFFEMLLQHFLPRTQ